ncbi:MAG: radical SAM family heme chaperone HemW [Acutalibacteraceae bacterium]
MLGLYIHVPFCLSKCPYCDFYSLLSTDESVLDAYTDAVCNRLSVWHTYIPKTADTLYFGGGTPSLLGGARLSRMIRHARALFGLENAEITLEANPADRLYDTFAAFADAGGNRLSMGMQAAKRKGLAALGRRHTPADLKAAVRDAHRAGLCNLSLDLMLATPDQTDDDIQAAVEACVSFDAAHLSAYLLKLEPGTPFFDRRQTLSLPDEDQAAALYLRACEQIEAAGYAQYEISNFARDGFESRHNLKYWNSEDYIGIGPSAHSFIGGKRWYYKRSLDSFLSGALPLAEDPDEAVIADGGQEEYAMLRLRLTAGLQAEAFAARFHTPLPSDWFDRARCLPAHLVQADKGVIRLTKEGFLLSNTLIPRILWG